MEATRRPPSNEAYGTVELRNRLRTAGLRATLPRIEVLRRLTASSTPLSHAELTKELVPLGFDRATVYRNLNDLVHAGLATKFELGEHVWRFESRSAQNRHPHFLCNDCGDVLCLADADVEFPASEPAVVRDVHDVILRGRCASC